MAKKHITVQSSNFQGGLNTLQPAHLLADGQTPNCQNVDFSRSLGRLTKRYGHFEYVTTRGYSDGAPTGLYEYITASGATRFFAVTKSVIYEIFTNAVPGWVPRYIKDGTTKSIDEVQLDSGAAAGQQVRVQTTTAHGYSTGNVVKISGLTGGTLTPYNGHFYTVTVSTSTKFFLLEATSGTALTNYTGLTGTSTLSSATALGETNFITFNDLCIAVSPQISTLKATTGDFSILLGTPPANGKYIENHKGRVFIANHGGGKSRLSFCYLNNPEDWTTIAGDSTDAGFVDVGLDDGDVITGIKSIGSVLLIFKNNSTWALFGSSASDFKVRKLSPLIGCSANRTIVAADNFAIFLAQQGVYAANSEGVTMMSYNIKPNLEAFTDAQRAGAVAGRTNTQYWLSYDASGDGKNESVYVLDYVLGVWGFYSNKKLAVCYTTRAGRLLAGQSDSDAIYAHNDPAHEIFAGTASTGNDAEGAVDMFWDTPDYDFGDWTCIKHPLDIEVVATPISGKTITVSHYVEGVVQSATLPFLLTASGSQDKVYLKKRHLPGTSYGGYLRFRLRNAEASALTQVFGYSIIAYVDERQNG